MRGPGLPGRLAARLALAGVALGLLAGAAPAQAAAPGPADGGTGHGPATAAGGAQAAGRAALDRKAGELGLSPINGYSCVLQDGGCVRSYHPEGSADRTVAVYWSAATGAHTVDLGHPVGRKFIAAGYERGPYGYPTSDLECGAEGPGCVQTFEHGQIDQAYVVAGQRALAAKAARLQLAPENGYNCALSPDGCVRSYTTAAGRHIAIYWSSASDAQAVDMDHAIGREFAASAYERGRYGYPVSDMVCSAGSGCRQDFQHGTITFNYNDAGTRALDAKAAALKLQPAGGYECQLAGDGCRRSYVRPDPAGGPAGQRVDLYWSATTGAHAVRMSHGIGREFAEAGLENGRYGYPTSEMMCSGNGCTQMFQKGTINLPAEPAR